MPQDPNRTRMADDQEPFMQDIFNRIFAICGTQEAESHDPASLALAAKEIVSLPRLTAGQFLYLYFRERPDADCKQLADAIGKLDSGPFYRFPDEHGDCYTV